MKRTITDEYESLEAADAGRRRRWAQGWLVRNRRVDEKPDRGFVPPDPGPGDGSIAGGVFMVAFAALLGTVGWLIWRKRPSRTVVVTYERARNE